VHSFDNTRFFKLIKFIFWILTFRETYVMSGEYVGAVNGDGRPHGQGTYKAFSGDVYVGEWEHGKQKGLGTYTWADRAEYIGQWKDDKMHGFGTYKWRNGDVYIGEWNDGIKHGQGTYKCADGVYQCLCIIYHAILIKLIKFLTRLMR
jgi:hypothetical protein